MLNFEEINKTEIVNIEGESPIRLHVQKLFGMKQYTVYASFVEDDEYLSVGQSLDPEEAKEVAINNLLENSRMWKSLE
ncbi:hypothetical protein M3589_15175 [Heyndrickxia oleronia]|uniref:hypothetical protein n=1 Tax=Heyndrickxia oleronia TaxID=38875 RepID=UPI00203D38A0|nr:hypothetical protein [Heyndrickxia oleronia]MCM3239064.1 hypothetical protein [Heyndrickxia oleronia]